MENNKSAFTQIIVDTPKGQYSIPLREVAKHRADYYATEIDGHAKHSPEWDKEVEWVMSDTYEAIDWILNNSDWEDWKGIATKINDEVNVTDSDFWTSSEQMEIK